MISFKHYSDLTDYLKGLLSKQESLKMEEALQQDATLAAAADDLAMIDELFLDYKLLEIENLAKEGYQKHRKTTQLKKIALGTGVLLALLGGAFYFLSGQDSATQPQAPAKKDIELTASEMGTTEIVPQQTEVQATAPQKESEQIANPELPETNENTAIVPDSITNTIALETTTATPTKTNDNTTIEATAATTEDPCVKHSPEIVLNTSPACADAKDGSVQVVVNEGKAPYDIKIYDETKAKQFGKDNLSDGLYTATVTDNNGCYNELVFEIEAKLCATDLKFTPATDGLLRFDHKNARLHVHSPSGKTYYEHTFTDQIRWDGKSNDGQVVPGYYIYNLEKDGKQLQFGSITILE